MKTLFSILSLSFILISCGSSELDENTKKMIVYDYAIDNVKTRIKDPNSIEIPSIIEKAGHVEVLNSSGTEFHIDSWFRSKNSFGGMVESTFSCDVTLSKDGNTIKGTNLLIE